MRVVVGTVKYFKKRALGGCSLSKLSGQGYKMSKWKVIWTYIKSLLKSILLKSVSFLIPAYRFSKDYKVFVLGDDGSKQSQNYHYFIGYYDIDPFNELTQKIVCHRVSRKYSNQVLPEIGDIGLLLVSTGEFEKLNDSRALNWQLGTRLQWLDREHVIYNDIKDGYQVSRKLNVVSHKVVKQYARAFWAISPNKKLAASLNFSRIRERRPGYGYRGKSTDGDAERLTLTNLDSGDVTYSINLNEILNAINYDSKGADLYLNHITWSPNSKKLLTIFHLSELEAGSRKVYPVLYDLVTSTWTLIDDSGFFSHNTWIDDSNILAYRQCEDNPKYCIWNIDAGWNAIQKSMPLFDGHPNLLNRDGDVVVDSYPDRLGKMGLYLGSISSEEKYKSIGFVMSPAKFSGALRCDLHPRISENSSKIICDIPTIKGRRIIVIEENYDK